MLRYLKAALGTSALLACGILVPGPAPGEPPPADGLMVGRRPAETRPSSRSGPKTDAGISHGSRNLATPLPGPIPTLHRRGTLVLTGVGTCVHDYDCDDCNPCTHDDCDSGTCVNTPREECSPCGDGLACNGLERCDADGNCLDASPAWVYFCVGGPLNGFHCPGGDAECHKCVGGIREGLTCCPLYGLCSEGTCIGGAWDGQECCPEGTCDQTGTCELLAVEPCPCRYFPDMICDEEAPSGLGETLGACVAYAPGTGVGSLCYTDGDCDDGLVCNGGEICLKHPTSQGYPPGHGGQCIGGLDPKAPCTTDAECAPDGQCAGVCRPDPEDPPPCGKGVPCFEPAEDQTEPTCGRGRCCSVDATDPDQFICCRTTPQDCLSTGCEGGVAPHRFLGIGDRPDTPYDDGGCTWVWPCLVEFEDMGCPEYSSGVAPEGSFLVDIDSIGRPACGGPYEVGDDYRFAVPDSGDWFLDVSTIRYRGQFEPGGYSRVLVRFYDTDGRAVAEIDGEISTDAGDTLRTVFPSSCTCSSTCALIRDVYIPPEGWITLQPYRADGSVADLSWLSTDEVDAGSNDPDKMWVNGGPVTDFLPGVPDILAFEIVADWTSRPYGACCDAEAGGCTRELSWLCEEAGNVFHGIGTFCSVCSDDPLWPCDSAGDCQRCRDGDRNGEVCCPGGGECVDGTCSGGWRDTLECCPNGSCDTSPVCNPVPPWCQVTACCDKATGACVEVTGNQCIGGPTPGDPCLMDDDCGTGGTCVWAGGQCEDGGATPGAKCTSDNDCIGLCADGLTPCEEDAECAGVCTGGLCDDAATPCKQDSPDCDDIGAGVCNFNVPCADDSDCASAGVNGPCSPGGPCVGLECLAPCPNGSNPLGFGTTCNPNCCDQPQLSGADTCPEAAVAVINIPALGGPPATYTFRGTNEFATYGDFIPEDQGGPGTCNYSIFDPEGDVRDRGWWHMICTDDCADIRIDLCCTSEISGEAFGEQWPFLLADCNPCTTFIWPDIVGQGSYLDEPIGSIYAPEGQGAPFCNSDDPWHTYKAVPAGHYYIPIYSAPDGHIGEYQLHITVGACAEAACCLPEAVCLGGPLNGASCATNDDCAPSKGDKICVGDTNRPNELCCPDGGECDNTHLPYPKCVGGSRDGFDCCDGGGECKGNCVSDCVTVREADCEALGGYWMGFGNIPPDQSPITECQPEDPDNLGTCHEWGSCCRGPGWCEDWSNPACDPTVPDDPNCCQPDGENCMDRKLCDILGGTFVAEAMCDYPLDPCPACEIAGQDNCQLCNDTDYLVLLSDLAAEPYGVVHADDFVPHSNQIDTVCVWGVYLERYGEGCSGTVEDNFRVRIYDDDNGLPGDLIAERSNIVNVPKSSVPDCPNWASIWDWLLPLEVFRLSFPTITLPAAGQTYWLEVANKTDVLVGGIEEPDNTCHWQWFQVLYGESDKPLAGNRHAAVGTDDRCLGGYYDGSACAARCIGDGAWCDHGANVCVGGDNDGRPCCPGGACKAGLGGGYTELSARWSGTAFCLGGPDGPVSFDPPASPTGACCDCSGFCATGLTQAECADFTHGGSDRRWTAGATCNDLGVCDLPDGDTCISWPYDPCGDPSPPGWDLGAIPVTDGLYGFDSSCATTDGSCCPAGQSVSYLGRDLWYCYTTTCTGELVASMCASSIYKGALDGYMAVHHDFDNPTECPCPGPTTMFQVYESDESCSGVIGGSAIYQDQIVFPGEAWLIRVGGWGNTEASTDGGRGFLEVACKATPCYPSSPPTLEVLNLDVTTPINRKNRFISVSLQDAGRQQAIRVVLGADDAGRGNIPPPFEIWKGQEFYAGEPRQYCENAGMHANYDPTTPCGPAPGVYENGQDWFWAAPLVCDVAAAHYMDWTTLADHCNSPQDGTYDGQPCMSDDDCGGGTCGVSPVVHLYHEGIVPSHMAAGAGPIDIEAVYEVSVIDSSCPSTVESSYSEPVQLHQAGWGDVVLHVADCPNWPPQESVGVVSDVVALLNKFSNLPCAVQKTRADLGPCRVDFNIAITDVVAALSAFGGGDYEDICGSGQCACVNPPSCTVGVCRGGADHGNICASDDDCSSDICAGKLGQ